MRISLGQPPVPSNGSLDSSPRPRPWQYNQTLISTNCTLAARLILREQFRPVTIAQTPCVSRLCCLCGCCQETQGLENSTSSRLSVISHEFDVSGGYLPARTDALGSKHRQWLRNPAMLQPETVLSKKALCRSHERWSPISSYS